MRSHPYKRRSRGGLMYTLAATYALIQGLRYLWKERR